MGEIHKPDSVTDWNAKMGLIIALFLGLIQPRIDYFGITPELTGRRR